MKGGQSTIIVVLMQTSVPRLVAHRGYAARYPENTLLAIQAAVEAGAHDVEFDIQLTADGVPVLFHDRDCQRMCGQPKPIHDYTLAEASQFSVSEFSRFGYRFVGNRLSSLEQVVNYLAGFPYVRAFVELKRLSLEKFGIDYVLDKVLPIISTLGDQAVVISYSLEALLATRERSGFSIAAVFDHWHERKQALIRQLKPEYLFTDIDELPRFGKLGCPQCELAVYECVDPKRAMDVHRRGVDMVETFDIAGMLQALSLYSERV